MAWSLFMLALALFPGSDTARANSLLEESLTLFSAISNKEGQARTLSLLGQLKLKQGEYITIPSQEAPLFRAGEEWRVLSWGMGTGHPCLLTTFTNHAILQK